MLAYDITVLLLEPLFELFVVFSVQKVLDLIVAAVVVVHPSVASTTISSCLRGAEAVMGSSIATLSPDTLRRCGRLRCILVAVNGCSALGHRNKSDRRQMKLRARDASSNPSAPTKPHKLTSAYIIFTEFTLLCYLDF